MLSPSSAGGVVILRNSRLPSGSPGTTRTRPRPLVNWPSAGWLMSSLYASAVRSERPPFSDEPWQDESAQLTRKTWRSIAENCGATGSAPHDSRAAAAAPVTSHWAGRKLLEMQQSVRGFTLVEL